MAVHTDRMTDPCVLLGLPGRPLELCRTRADYRVRFLELAQERGLAALPPTPRPVCVHQREARRDADGRAVTVESTAPT